MYAGNAALKGTGALSVAVPGELAGLHKVWKIYGKIPWNRLVTPAAQMAQNGFKISPFLYMQMAKTETGIMADKGLRKTFMKNDCLLKPGDTCYNKKLAKTLSEIARNGIKAFYNGSIGLKLVEDVKKAGGILTMEDLKNYQVKIREPVSIEVFGVNILGMPPPSSGGAAMSLVSEAVSLLTTSFFDIVV